MKIGMNNGQGPTETIKHCPALMVSQAELGPGWGWDCVHRWSCLHNHNTYVCFVYNQHLTLLFMYVRLQYNRQKVFSGSSHYL